jgi:hypothetical protein
MIRLYRTLDRLGRAKAQRRRPELNSGRPEFELGKRPRIGLLQLESELRQYLTPEEQKRTDNPALRTRRAGSAQSSLLKNDMKDGSIFSQDVWSKHDPR